MLNRQVPPIALITVFVLALAGLSPGAQDPSAPKSKAESSVVVCRVMEAFEDSRLGVRAIIFHQRDKADGPRLGSLLSAQSGKEMEFETTGGHRFRATVFRVRSAFGRGLVLVPTNMLKLDEHDEFTLHVPPGN